MTNLEFYLAVLDVVAWPLSVFMIFKLFFDFVKWSGKNNPKKNKN